MFTVGQVAKRLGIQPGAVRDAIARGRMVAVRDGGSDDKAGHLLIMKDELERYEREVAGKRGPKQVSAQAPRKTKPRRKNQAVLDKAEST